MFSQYILIMFLVLAGLIEGATLDISHRANLVTRQRGGQQGGQTCLNSNLIQTASTLTGQEDGTEGIKPGQAPSAVDKANFVNFCEGQELTNGMQILTGSCNGIPMGKIPAKTNMISAVITNPKVGVQIPSDTTFNIEVQTQHLSAGFFVNPTTNYYTAPQDLDKNGDIIGHCHVTVQDIGDMQVTTPPDPTTFAYFKGIDDAGNGRGLLQAVVQGGLPVGIYRVCTMIAARNHQPVNMPVAQRGAQDDCTKFEVVQSGNPGKQPSPNDKNGDGRKNQNEEGIVKNKGAKGNGAQGSGGNGNANTNGNANGNNNANTNGNASGNNNANTNGNANGNNNANTKGNANGNSNVNTNGNANGNNNANSNSNTNGNNNANGNGVANTKGNANTNGNANNNGIVNCTSIANAKRPVSGNNIVNGSGNINGNGNANGNGTANNNNRGKFRGAPGLRRW